MSTKASIAFGDDFHFYRDMMDGSIHLMIDLTKSPGHVIHNISDERIDIEIPKHILKAILDEKDRLMEGWEHLFDDPILGILSKLMEKKKAIGRIEGEKEEPGCPRCGVSGFTSPYKFHMCPWCGYIYNSKELKEMKGNG